MNDNTNNDLVKSKFIINEEGFARVISAVRSDDKGTPCFEIPSNETKSGHTHMFEMMPSHEDLQYFESINLASISETTLDGTCQLWVFGSLYLVVLQDNTVITIDEDNASDEPLFPWNTGAGTSK